MIRSLHRALVTVSLIALAGMQLEAQEGPVSFEFSFSNPGARSMALGGAFAALADDATAAFANPAGLVQLIDPELSVEGRMWSYDIPFVQGGRASGSPSGLGIDTAAGIRQGVSSTDTSDLSFASFVYPWKRWSLAAYRHTWANFTTSRRVDGLFAEIDGEDERSEDVLASTDVRVINIGLAAGFEITKRLSIGIGLVRFDAELASLSVEFGQDDEAFYDVNGFLPEHLDTTSSFGGTDTGTVVHAGILWRATPQWSIGGFFRQGPALTLRIREVTGPANDAEEDGTVELDAATPFDLPDVFGLGVAYRTTGGAWTIGFEWSRVRYSAISRSLDSNVFDPDQIALSDGDEYHLGVEYVILASKPIIGLRLGTWYDPAHNVKSGPGADLFESTIFPAGDDELHVTGGIGLVFGRFQIDLGADLSKRVDLASLSFVFRF